MKYLFQLLILSLLISSCDVLDPYKFNPIQLVSDPVVDKRTPHKDLSNFETYSDINKTSGDIIPFKYFSGFYWTHNMELEYWDGNWDDDFKYSMNRVESVYLDYNRDGFLDLFGHFRAEYSSTRTSEMEGMYYIYDDVHSETPQRITQDNDINFGTNKYYLGDIDGDGLEEVITKNDDGHITGHGEWPDEPYGPIKIIGITTEGVMSQKYIGNNSDPHDIATGDIDNDGDIDIVSWETSQEYPHEIRLPMFYMNNGDGTFYQSDFEERFKNKELLHDTSGSGRKYQWFHMLNLLLIDLNNDSYLDLVVGDDLNSCKETWRERDFCDEYTKIFWNDGSGRYDFKDYTILENNSLDKYQYLFSDNNIYTVDFIPFDFNNDGNLDLFSIISIDWTGSGYIQVHQNNGDKSFTDVTDDVIENIPPTDGSDETHTNCPTINKYTFSYINSLVPYDKDNDGDYDLVPSKIGHGKCNNPDNTNDNNGVFWENNNGKFSIVGN